MIIEIFDFKIRAVLIGGICEIIRGIGVEIFQF